jgi:hypothetical protein
MKSPEKIGAGGSGAKHAAAKDSLRALRTQLNRRLALIPCRRAIAATDAPGDSASATIRRFSSSGHVLRARFVRSRGPALSNTALNDYRPATGCL